MYDCSTKQHIPFLTLLAQRKSRKSVVYQRVCAIYTFALTLSRIPTAKTYHCVTMYYSHPCLLAKSSIAAQNLSHGANVISNGSPSRIRSVRRISLGITTRPRSSILLTIPVAFMVASSNTVSICSVWLQSYCLQRKEKYSVPGKDTLCVASGRDRAMRGRALRLHGGFLLPRGLDETPPGHVK